MRRIGHSTLAILAAATFATLGIQPVTALAATDGPATVTRVVDGDTVDVRFADDTRARVRLIGIDTPEVVDPRKPVQCFGREASAHARELLDGQSVTIELDPSQGQRDRYRRLLAYLRLPDGRDFGEVMLGDGYGHEYTYRLPYAHQDDYLQAEQAAIAAQRGLWAPDACADDTRRPDPATGQPTSPPTDGFDPSLYVGHGNRFDCAAFSSQARAQAVLRADPRDPNRLDGNRDGIACEANGPPRDLAPVGR